MCGGRGSSEKREVAFVKLNQSSQLQRLNITRYSTATDTFTLIESQSHIQSTATCTFATPIELAILCGRSRSHENRSYQDG